MKKSKNGWGLQTALLFILMFLACLVIAIIGINKFGILGYIDLPGVKDSSTNYELLEEKLVEAAKEYVYEEHENNLNENTLILRVSHLIKNKYLEEVSDNNGNVCSGYVEVIKTESNNIVYYPYLKCKKYTTYEYDERKDW